MHINPSGETWNPLKRATFPPHYKLNAYIIDLQKNNNNNNNNYTVEVS